jgi:hypothetical protein
VFSALDALNAQRVARGMPCLEMQPEFIFEAIEEAKCIESYEQDGRYPVNTIPKKLPAGEVLVHNHIRPARPLSRNGFRAWTAKPTDGLELCTCKMAGMALHGLKHYRVKSAFAAKKSA